MKRLLHTVLAVALLAVVLLFVGCSSGSAGSGTGNSTAEKPEATESVVGNAANTQEDEGGQESSSSANQNDADNSADSSEASEQEDFTLVVGYSPDNAPFAITADDGQIAGLDVDLATIVARMNGWNISFVPIDPADKMALLASGEITCYWCGMAKDGLEDVYAFTRPYYLNEVVVVVRWDTDMVYEEDLAGAHVVVQQGTWAEGVLSGDKASLTQTFGALDVVDDCEGYFELLKTGEIDAIVCDTALAHSYISSDQSTYKQLLSLSARHYAVAFDKANTELATIVNTSLSRLTRDSTAKQLCQKYARYGLYSDDWIMG